jgi:hypothetical protein
MPLTHFSNRRRGGLRQKNVASSIFVRGSISEQLKICYVEREGFLEKSALFVWPLVAAANESEIQRLRGLRIVCYFKSARRAGGERARVDNKTHYCMYVPHTQ